MNDDTHKAVQELLKEIFNNVNSWLTHAETKNAAIIAFNIACLSSIWDMKDVNEVKVLVYFICIGMVLSTIMALISFFPKMGKKNENKSIHSGSDNLIFYKDIAKYSKEEYIKAVFKQYMQIDILDSEIQKIEMDFSEEITYNAFITITKYKWFNNALRTEIVMLILLAFAIVIA